MLKRKIIVCDSIKWKAVEFLLIFFLILRVVILMETFNNLNQEPLFSNPGQRARNSVFFKNKFVSDNPMSIIELDV